MIVTEEVLVGAAVKMKASLSRAVAPKWLTYVGRRFIKYLAVLSIWGLVACAMYKVWADLESINYKSYTLSTTSAHVQQEPINAVSAAGRTTLPSDLQSSSLGPTGVKKYENVTAESTHTMLKPPELSKSARKIPESKLSPTPVAGKGTLAASVQNTIALNSKASLIQVSSMLLPISSPSGNSSSLSSTLPGISKNGSFSNLLCVRFCGRLGNELFEYASTLGLALTLNRVPVFLGSSIIHKVLKHFTASPMNLNFTELQQRCQKAKIMHEALCCKYKEEMTQLDPMYDYKIGERLQSYKYFDNHTAQIRKALTFSDRIQDQAEQIVRDFRQRYKSSTLVGVHIRHGDMAQANNQKKGYPLASPDYIKKALSYFSQLYPNCVFVVVSDSIEWCKNNAPKGYNITFLSGNEPAVDMLTLASLDHVITSFGTFSWWIGYLSRGKVVYMKDFIRVNTKIAKNFNPKGKDYVYPGWIPL